MALTLRPNDAQEKQLEVLKDFYREKVNTKAVFRAIGDVPKMDQRISELERQVRQLEDKLYDHKCATTDFLDSLDRLRELSDSNS